MTISVNFCFEIYFRADLELLHTKLDYHNLLISSENKRKNFIESTDNYKTINIL